MNWNWNEIESELSTARNAGLWDSWWSDYYWGHCKQAITVPSHTLMPIQDELQCTAIPETTSTTLKRPAQSAPSTPRKPKKPKPEESDGSPIKQSLLHAHFNHKPASTSSIPRPSSPSDVQKHYEIQISDTKTRKSWSIPDHDDTLSARVQLMLYHRMLALLLSPSTLLSTTADVFKGSRLKTQKPFSDTFIAQAYPQLARDKSDPLVITNLDGLVQLLLKEVQRLGVMQIAATLKIVYRKQPSSGDAKGKQKAGEETQLQDDLDRAIAASLGEGGIDGDLEKAIAASLKDVEAAVGHTKTEDTGAGVSSQSVVEGTIPTDGSTIGIQISSFLIRF